MLSTMLVKAITLFHFLLMNSFLRVASQFGMCCACMNILYGRCGLCRQGDSALLLPSNQQVMHECLVEHVGRESVVLKITEKAKQARSLDACGIVMYVLRISHWCDTVLPVGFVCLFAFCWGV